MLNHLSQESSPYLQQHSSNPVDWLPWSSKALQLARERDCPILLSIGYSTCHWCHVMAKESFSDQHTADIMNEKFVNIKVDREERPDLDQIYQISHNLLSGQPGGWPLTVFLNPQNHIPIFTGTYFPPVAKYQLPGFCEVLNLVANLWVEKKPEINKQSKQIAHMFARMNNIVLDSKNQTVDYNEILELAKKNLGLQYDSSAGGFGSAPKFPMLTNISWLLHNWHSGKRQDTKVLTLIIHTLTSMARGGIYDHLGGGFFRYTTDRYWQIPHFEKMLYDNGLFLSIYADALGVDPDDSLFYSALKQTADWLQSSMQDSKGGYYAALDADSDGEEGKYYVWHKREVKTLLNDKQYLLITTLFGIDKPANFETRWHLHRTDALAAVARRLYMQLEQAETLLQQGLAKMMTVRNKRCLPHLDHKIICSWNALAVKGMVKAGQRLAREDWLDSAQKAVDFIYQNMWQQPQLYSISIADKSKQQAFLDDYAFLLDAVLTLMESRWSNKYAQFCLDLATQVIAQFKDVAGSFYFVPANHEKLIHKPRTMQDSSTPSGNAVLAHAFYRLGHLFAEPDYIDAAESIIKAASNNLKLAPEMHTGLLAAQELLTNPYVQVIIIGPQEQCNQWLRTCLAGYHPQRFCYAIPVEKFNPDDNLIPYLSTATQEQTTRAYVCTNLSCQSPIYTLAELQAVLS